MKRLRGRLMVAVVAMGLIVGTPLLARELGPVPAATDGGNYLDALAIAKANVQEAMKTALLPETKLQPDVAKKVLIRLREAVSQIDKSEQSFRLMYKKRPSEIADPRKDLPATLKGQLDEAVGELESGSSIIEDFGSEENKKLKPVKDALEAATSKLTDARNLMPSVGMTPMTEQQRLEAAKTLKDTELAKQQQAAAQAKKQADADLARQQEAARQSEIWRQVLLGGGASLLAIAAILIVFLPIGPVKELRSSQQTLNAKLKSLESRPSELEGNVAGLKQEIAGLRQEIEALKDAVKEIADAAQPTVVATQTTWTGEDRRKDNRRKDSSLASRKEDSQTFLNMEVGAKAEENVGEADGIAAAVPTLSKSRQPLADYNEIRAMKAADRATEFAQLYPKQMVMACANPAARNSGPFTDLRFKEDQYGKFQAVEHGKETLLFPELNYDYSTGRKTLEGVFQYPEVDSPAIKLTQAAVVEKRGEEWALTRQGVFRNG